MKYLLIILLLIGCKKEKIECVTPGNVVIVSKNIVTWSNKVPVIIEVKGLDNPYHFFIERDKEHRIEGHAMIRVRTECSQWGAWKEINY